MSSVQKSIEYFRPSLPSLNRRGRLLSFPDVNEDGLRPVVVRALAYAREQDFHILRAVFVLAGEIDAVGLLRAPAEAVETPLKLLDVLKGRDFAEKVAPRDVNRGSVRPPVLF